MIGMASSLVAMNTAISAPIEILRSLNSSAETTENPHCGTDPKAAPTTGLAFPFSNFDFSNLKTFLNSRNSIKR